MSYYKLSPSRRSNNRVDSVIFGRDPETGAKLIVSTTTPAEMTADQVDSVQALGLKLTEVDAPEEDQGSSQPVGADVAGQATVKASSGSTGASLLGTSGSTTSNS